MAEHLLPTPTTSNRNGNRVNGRGEMLLPGVAIEVAISRRLFSTPDTVPEAPNTGSNSHKAGNTVGLGNQAVEVSGGSDWGNYATAVEHWERITRPAPPPVRNDGKGGKARLNPELPEWMMGLEHGHITADEIGLTRPEQLKAAGNGVVPQQAEAATVELLHRAPLALALLRG